MLLLTNIKMTSIKSNQVYPLILVMLFLLASTPAWSATYRYSATTISTVKKTGTVKAGGFTWFCRARNCNASSTLRTPSLTACKAFVKKVGSVRSFGHNQQRLNKTQLAQCNKIQLTGRAQKYSYTARTKTKVRRSGIIKLRAVSWNCRANSNSCTASGPWPNPSNRACNALANQIGEITYYGYPQKRLTRAQLLQCNTTSASSAPILRPQRLSRSLPRLLIRPRAMIKASPVPTQPDKKPIEKEEEKEPTGPDVTKPVDLISALIDVPEIESDFQNAIGWFHQIFPDITARNIYYYVPSEYRISRDPNPKVGFNLKFTYGYSNEASAEALVSLNVTLEPPHQEGDLKLLNELAKHSLNTKEEIELRPFPMLSAKIDFAELQQAFDVKPENISITAPQHVRDPVQLTIRMKETVKEELITHLRNIGLAGRIVIEGKNADLEIPISLGFTEYAGPVVTAVSEVGPGKPIKNMSPFPVSLAGFASYSLSKEGRLLRNTHSFKKKVRIQPGGSKSVPDLINTVKGEPILAWFDYEKDLSCGSCFDAIEKQILAVAGLTSKDTLSIEAIPSLFGKFDIYKVIVEIKSSYFNPGSSSEQIRNISLKEKESSEQIPIYIDRDQSSAARKFSFRYKPVMNDGTGSNSFSRWIESDTLDITITPAHINDVSG